MGGLLSGLAAAAVLSIFCFITLRSPAPKTIQVVDNLSTAPQ